MLLTVVLPWDTCTQRFKFDYRRGVATKVAKAVSVSCPLLGIHCVVLPPPHPAQPWYATVFLHSHRPRVRAHAGRPGTGQPNLSACSKYVRAHTQCTTASLTKCVASCGWYSCVPHWAFLGGRPLRDVWQVIERHVVAL